tara:strand:- start:640 stop:777 length:138 start_codon:yes stop_codon:yes gene_type:complete
LKEFLKPNDHYPDLNYLLKNRSDKLPIGSFSAKEIINGGVNLEKV